MTERIEFQGKPITEDEFIHYLTIVEKHADEDVTFFEILCAMAFLGFNEKKADINLIEVGLGYIFDATRTIENPLITVICPISLEHRNFLGPELKDVVRNKVFDISKKTNIIISKQDPANLKYMEYNSKAFVYQVNTLVGTFNPILMGASFGLSHYMKQLDKNKKTE